MKTMFGFMGTMLLMPKPWLVWIGLLMAVNLVAPLFFLATLVFVVPTFGFMLSEYVLVYGSLVGAHCMGRLLLMVEGRLEWG